MGVGGGFARLDPPNLGGQGSVAGVARASRVLYIGLSRMCRGRPLSPLCVRMHMCRRVSAPPVCSGGMGGMAQRCACRSSYLPCPIAYLHFIPIPIPYPSLMVFYSHCYFQLFASIFKFIFLCSTPYSFCFNCIKIKLH